MLRPGRMKLAGPRDKAVLYYADDECWCWAKYQWWNPTHWFMKKRNPR